MASARAAAPFSGATVSPSNSSTLMRVVLLLEGALQLFERVDAGGFAHGNSFVGTVGAAAPSRYPLDSIPKSARPMPRRVAALPGVGAGWTSRGRMRCDTLTIL